MKIQSNIERKTLIALLIVTILILASCSTNSSGITSQSDENQTRTSPKENFDKKKDLEGLKKELVSLISPFVFADHFLNSNLGTITKDSTMDDLQLIKEKIGTDFTPLWDDLNESKATAVTNLRGYVGNGKYSKLLFDESDSLEEVTDNIISQVVEIQDQAQLDIFISGMENNYSLFETGKTILLTEVQYLIDDIGYSHYENQTISAKVYSEALHKYGNEKAAEKFDQDNLIN